MTKKLTEKEKEVRRVSYFTIGSIVGAIGMGLFCYFSASSSATRIYPTTDLNKDGIEDRIVEQENGYMKPMYSIIEKGKVIYVSASELERRKQCSDPVCDTIEDKLGGE